MQHLIQMQNTFAFIIDICSGFPSFYPAGNETHKNLSFIIQYTEAAYTNDG